MSHLKASLLFILAITLGLAPCYLEAAGNPEQNSSPDKAQIRCSAPAVNFQACELENFVSSMEENPEYLLALVEPGETPMPAMPPMPPMFFNQDSSGRAGHEERIELFRLWRVMNEVNLTDEQVDKFFPLMRKLQRTERDIAKERRALLDSLKAEVDKKSPNRAVLQNLMTRIENNGQQMWRVKKETTDKVLELLSVEQKARFVIATSNMENDLWQAIARVRAGEGRFGHPDMEQMKNLRKNLEKMRQDLKRQGLPDVNIDLKGLGDEDSTETHP